MDAGKSEYQPLLSCIWRFRLQLILSSWIEIPQGIRLVTDSFFLCQFWWKILSLAFQSSFCHCNSVTESNLPGRMAYGGWWFQNQSLVTCPHCLYLWLDSRLWQEHPTEGGLFISWRLRSREKPEGVRGHNKHLERPTPNDLASSHEVPPPKDSLISL